jgi:hypothetical protein
MHNGATKKWALALTFWLALHVSSLRAQIFTAPLQASTTGTNPVDFEFRADGTLVAIGNSGVGSLLTGDEGAGTRMVWFPSLGAFRAGSVDGTEWDQSSIGTGSIALGINTTASGYASTAAGGGTTAGGDDSVAMGGGSVAYGQWSVALGGYAGVVGFASIALGYQTAVYGDESTGMGSWTLATGEYSTAMGTATTASGNYSTASGYNTVAASYASFATGYYNVGGGTADSWIDTDPLFEIGNGTSTTPADALVVYKNGNAVLQGTLQVAPGGDIPMYTGE